MSDAQVKTQRVLAAIENRELDRVPVGEFFWTNFLRRAVKELGVNGVFDPYRYWDLDLIVINPNMDPHITGIEVLENTPDRKLVKTGFGATVERRSTYPMPHYIEFETETFEQMEAFEFDDPKDPRRYFEAIDDMINAVGDKLNLNLPSFVDRVDIYADDFCIFGIICEPHVELWRILGTENGLYKLG
ncbi:MAG: hypothetical protein QF541_22875, partial [Lentisphaeria bacterium]|nr:hypothetical protein [Lentisphaeria bacterium]